MDKQGTVNTSQIDLPLDEAAKDKAIKSAMSKWTKWATENNVDPQHQSLADILMEGAALHCALKPLVLEALERNGMELIDDHTFIDFFNLVDLMNALASVFGIGQVTGKGISDAITKWEAYCANTPDDNSIVADTPAIKIEQLTLIPELKKPLAVIMKKSAMACIGHTNYIRRKYPHLLPVKFSDGKTLAQYLDEADDWFRKLEGRDMEMWIRMFSFIQAVSDYKEQNEITDLQEVGKGSGIYSFLLATNPNFYKFFEDPAGIKKKNGKEYFTTKQRERICKWIKDNQGVIKFPVIEKDNEGHEYIDPAAPQFVYWLSERVDTATGKVTSELRINTNIIDTMFRNYGKITLAELDNIKAAWKEYCDTDNEFTDYQLTSFFDLPIKFLIGLTQSYTPKREYTNSGYVGATIEWSAEMLDKQLGGLKERLAKHKSSARIGGDIMRIRAKLLDVTFAIGVQLKWLVDRPVKYENGVFTFPVNPGYFAPQRTAQRITAAKHE